MKAAQSLARSFNIYFLTGWSNTRLVKKKFNSGRNIRTKLTAIDANTDRYMECMTSDQWRRQNFARRVHRFMMMMPSRNERLHRLLPKFVCIYANSRGHVPQWPRAGGTIESHIKQILHLQIALPAKLSTAANTWPPWEYTFGCIPTVWWKVHWSKIVGYVQASSEFSDVLNNWNSWLSAHSIRPCLCVDCRSFTGTNGSLQEC